MRAMDASPPTGGAERPVRPAFTAVPFTPPHDLSDRGHAANGPVSVAVFRVDALRFALPLAIVDRIVRAVHVTPLPDAPPAVAGIVNVHGSVQPVLDMRRKFLQRHREITPADHFVLAQAARGPVVLLVDYPEGILEGVPSHTTLPAYADGDQFSGVVRVDDGLVLIHDLDRFLSPDDGRALTEAMNRLAPDPQSAGDRGSP